MKAFIRATACAAFSLSMASCFSVQPRLIPFKGPTPDLGLRPDQKLPLRVAVVVPDPMGFRCYLSMAGGRAHSAPQDQTEHFGGEKDLPLAGELARLADLAFPAAFQSVSMLRQLPAPGEYDAVVELAVTALNEDFAWGQPLFGPGGTFIDLSMNWKMTVMAKGNVEVLTKEETTDTVSFHTRSHTFTDEVMAADVAREGGKLLSSLTREAALAARDRLARSAR